MFHRMDVMPGQSLSARAAPAGQEGQEGRSSPADAFFKIFFFFYFYPFTEYHFKSSLIMHLSARVGELCLLKPVSECLSC